MEKRFRSGLFRVALGRCSTARFFDFPRRCLLLATCHVFRIGLDIQGVLLPFRQMLGLAGRASLGAGFRFIVHGERRRMARAYPVIAGSSLGGRFESAEPFCPSLPQISGRGNSASLAGRCPDAPPHLDSHRQVRVAVMHFEEILHRAHESDGQLRAILHKSRLVERPTIFARDDDLDALHRANDTPHRTAGRLSVSE